MDYERMEKPQGGGISPGKLRSMLLGIEKKRKEKEELESTFSLSSEVCEIDDRGFSTSESCKDVDIVSIFPESYTSTTGNSLASEMANDIRLNEQAPAFSRTRSQQDGNFNYDSGHDSAGVSSSMFEFQKAGRGSHRMPIAPFSKPAPSKWDDAQKWIASPTSDRPKTGQIQVQGTQVAGSRKTSFFGYGSRQVSTKLVVEVPDQKMVVFEEADTKKIDLSEGKREVGGQKFDNWVPDPDSDAESYAKPTHMVKNSIADSAVSLSQHDSSISVRSAVAFVPFPSTVRSVSMRDMGTEMTPIASQEPSRTGTPVRATTPTRSPTSSRPSTPGRALPASSPVEHTDCQLDPNKELSEKELQMRTRKEILILGTQLGKMNIAAWASKGEEDTDASSSLKTASVDQPSKSVIDTRAASWEEAEKAKYMARYKREEMEIQAWENLQTAKTEAEIRKIEVEVERMRGRAQDKLMNKLAAARHKAEEKRAAAEAKRSEQAAKTEQQADYIRKTGRIPSSLSFSCCNWCF